MIDERERCLELLGLKPGASAQEIKAAYRDMAKVWHPDRFAHDPRLQAKAQNKLKEINEAYEALTCAGSGRAARAPQSATRPSTNVASAPPTSAQHSDRKSHWPLTVVLIICVAAAGVFVAPRLLKRTGEETAQASVVNPSSDEESAAPEAASSRKEKKSAEKPKAPATVTTGGPSSSQMEPAAPLRALPTRTVTIDPTTGMLAKANCPIKSSMTYVAGQEPRQYCSADHRATAASEPTPEAKKKSKLKALADSVAAPARWLKDKAKEAGRDN
ncbi:MAG: hypothetical protein QOF02_2384 [Blastocatellia bacterium]|jgi:hypothetical protein|nr:hypothetical protein [Blastocatellia bacterium]